jgi:hypothetical protein
MLQKCSIVAHSVHSASHPKLRRNSRNSFRPPTFAARRFAVTGFPRLHEPAKDIVNHQMVNAWLMPLRATAEGADGRFGRISRADEAMAERVARRRCDRWRIFASLCVTLATEKTPKSPLFEPFFGQNRWSNRQSGEKACRRQYLRRVDGCYKSVALWRISVRSPAARKFAPAARKFGKNPEIHRTTQIWSAN